MDEIERPLLIGLTIILLIILAVFIVKKAMAEEKSNVYYTYSLVNPVEFFKTWRVIGHLPRDNDMNTVWLVNPDLNHIVSNVKVETYSFIILAYTYWVEGTLYRFERNMDIHTDVFNINNIECFELDMVVKVE